MQDSDPDPGAQLPPLVGLLPVGSQQWMESWDLNLGLSDVRALEFLTVEAPPLLKS